MLSLHRKAGLFLFALLAGPTGAAHAQAVDVAAAEQLLSANKCSKCHSVDKQKDGPPYKKTAAKYKGQQDAEAKLVKHLTTSPKIDIDGVKEEHPNIRSSDAGTVKNVARYILTR